MYVELNINQFLDNEIRKDTEKMMLNHYDKVLEFNSEVRRELIDVCEELSGCCGSLRDTIRRQVDAMEISINRRNLIF